MTDVTEIETLTIGEAAALSGLSAHTLRYYERAGLLEPIARGARGERRYAARDLEWIAFLQRLRATAMPIREMRRFAELRTGGTATISARRALLAEHQRRVLAMIDDLRRNLEAIEAKLVRLETGDGNAKE